MIDKYGEPGRGDIVAAAEDISLKDMIAEEEMAAVTVYHDDYAMCKVTLSRTRCGRLSPSTF